MPVMDGPFSLEFYISRWTCGESKLAISVILFSYEQLFSRSLGVDATSFVA